MVGFYVFRLARAPAMVRRSHSDDVTGGNDHASERPRHRLNAVPGPRPRRGRARDEYHQSRRGPSLPCGAPDRPCAVRSSMTAALPDRSVRSHCRLRTRTTTCAVATHLEHRVGGAICPLPRSIDHLLVRAVLWLIPAAAHPKALERGPAGRPAIIGQRGKSSSCTPAFADARRVWAASPKGLLPGEGID